MGDQEIHAIQQATTGPAPRLVVALAAVHAARPKADRELTLDAAGLPSRRITIAGFAAASGELDVPLAHTILRRSLVEFYAGESRLCVIDACSAAEIALATALTGHLRARGLPEAEIEQLLRLASGIADSYPTYRDVVAAGQSAVSRGRVIDQLANPRNRAVHAGEHPDEAIARRAIETASLLAQEAVPLPRPADMLTLTRSRSRRQAPRRPENQAALVRSKHSNTR